LAHFFVEISVGSRNVLLIHFGRLTRFLLELHPNLQILISYTNYDNYQKNRQKWRFFDVLTFYIKSSIIRQEGENVQKNYFSHTAFVLAADNRRAVQESKSSTKTQNRTGEADQFQMPWALWRQY
jgi:nucleoside-specific outer membrane channel protein Tsx